MVKISIGLPFYNDEKTLKCAINSVLMQTYQDWELILLDDGSSDDSLNIAKSINDNRIVLLSDGINKGLATRLNEITKLARGEYIVRMDADDLMHPERIEKQFMFLEEHPTVDVVGSNAYSIDVNGALLGIRRKQAVPKDMYSVFKRGIFIHPSIMGKKQWFSNNLYEESQMAYRAEDYELWCRTAANSKFFIMEEPLLFYREANSIARNINNYLNTFCSMEKILKKYAPKEVGINRFLLLYMGIYLRRMIYCCLTPIGMGRLLIKKRYEEIPVNKRRKLTELLHKITKENI